MIGLDTNVIIRYLVQDDRVQSRLASELVDGLSVDRPGYLCLISLAEIDWVLRHSYRLSAEDAREVLSGLFDTIDLVVERPDLVGRALVAAHAGLDFADVLIAEANRAAGCRATMTFDRKAARHDGFELVSRQGGS